MQTHPDRVKTGTAVVTGARGIGYEVGRGLARAGFHVVFGVRNPELGEKAVRALCTDIPQAEVTHQRLDLADLSSVAEFGMGMRSRHETLEVLVNNAGIVMPPNRETTADGFELHFGTNHLGHFALVSALLPLLKAADKPRVVVVGSLAHRRAKIDFDDLQSERNYQPFKAYGQSKLANLLFMAELQRRSDAGGWTLTAAGAHPGFARTEAILRSDDGLAKRVFTRAMSGLIPTAASAARPIVFAGLSPEVSPAGYYGPSGPGEIAGRAGPAKLSALALNPELSARLWRLSEKLTGASFAAEG
ncbi:MAG TPA: SDR family oxidoreductase [Acidimicrobiales bacterium]|nr:SDR family oxidoreductase [Acidimicrobiales bacterium]